MSLALAEMTKLFCCILDKFEDAFHVVTVGDLKLVYSSWYVALQTMLAFISGLLEQAISTSITSQIEVSN